MVPVDPGGHPHPTSQHPFGLRHIESPSPEQIYGRRELSHPATPLQAMPSGVHQFHGQPPPTWVEAQSRGAQGPSITAGVGHSASQGIPHAGGPRRSPRGNVGPVLRFELPAPHHIHPLHPRPHPSGTSAGPGHHLVQRPNPRGCGIGLHPGALQQRSNVMRAPPGAPVCGPRRRSEHPQLVGPMGEPIFVGSHAVNGGETNAGPETVSRVLIPNCKIGAVIGKGGAIIKHIREVSK